MAEDFIREIGRIERIVNIDYINGQVSKTHFEMKRLSTRTGDWADTKNIEFFGEIPKEFVGKEAMYIYTKEENDYLKRERADIQIGKIAVREVEGDMIYDIISNDAFDPRIPIVIRSERLHRIKENIFYPYEHLSRRD